MNNISHTIKTSFFLIVSLMVLTVYGQDNKSNGLFNRNFDHGKPIDLPLSLAGNFGEVRGSHFHAGIDIKTNGKEGYPVYSIEEGYVSRIKVSSYGYGKALYITHPNGYTSVYGHLQSFEGAIDSFIKAKHYANQKNSIDVPVPVNRLKVSRGEVVAISGNSGGSGGPHLHFEIRETKSALALNPLLFNFNYVDKIPPIVKNIGIEGISKDAGIKLKASSKAKRKQIYALKKVGDIHTVNLYDTIEVYGTIGFSVDVIDRMDGSYNTLGVYETKLFIDGEEICYIEKDQLSFIEGRYVNCYVDHEEKKQHKRTLHRAFKLPGNFLSIYDRLKDKGRVTFSDNKVHDIEFQLSDVNGNTSRIQFKVKSLPFSMELEEGPKYDQFLNYNTENRITKDGLSVYMPQYALYKSFGFKYDVSESRNVNACSPIHHLHNESVPVHKYYQLHIRPDSSQLKWKDKMTIVSIEDDGELAYEGGEYKNGYVATKTRVFGDFMVVIDTVPPLVETENVYDGIQITDQKELVFMVSDDLSIKKCWMEANGNWLLSYYDAKNNHLIYTVDDHLPKGEVELKAIALDDLENRKEITVKIKN